MNSVLNRRNGTTKSFGFGSIEFISSSLAMGAVMLAKSTRGLWVQGNRISLDWAVQSNGFSKLRKWEELLEETYYNWDVIQKLALLDVREAEIQERGQHQLILLLLSLTFCYKDCSMAVPRNFTVDDRELEYPRSAIRPRTKSTRKRSPSLPARQNRFHRNEEVVCLYWDRPACR